MKSLMELYKIGNGPSSSHTMGPERAAMLFKSENPGADEFRVILYGSLAKTGRGHMTDIAMRRAFSPAFVKIEFCLNPDFVLPHPNTLDLLAFTGGIQTGKARVMSIGGGDIIIDGKVDFRPPELYGENTFSEISNLCKRKHIRLSDYVEYNEGKEIWDYLHTIWETMKQCIAHGLSITGALQGGLHVERKAHFLFNQHHIDESPETRENRFVCAYAFAVSEQNASGFTVVTAPTCGSSGVVPAALKYMQEKKHFSDEQVVRALAAGGIIGSLVKRNASVSGPNADVKPKLEQHVQWRLRR